MDTVEVIKEMIQNAELTASFLVLIVWGCVQAFKSSFNIDKRLLPLLSLVTGMLVSATVYTSLGFDIAQGLLVGALSGLGASGFYDNLNVGKRND